MKISLCLLIGFLLVGCRVTPTGSRVQNELERSELYTHRHYHHEGGLLLGGYPWGVFGLQKDFDGRVKHKLNNQELGLANKIFESLGAHGHDPVMVAFPIALENQGYNPFGDGQFNAHADFATWEDDEPPYIAMLDEGTLNSKLTVLFHKKLSLAPDQKIEWKFGDDTLSESPVNILGHNLPQSIQKHYSNQFELNVNKHNLKWSEITDGKLMVFRPKGWTDWFVVKFQSPFVPIKALVLSVPQRFRSFSAGPHKLKIPNPLGIDAAHGEQPLRELFDGYSANHYKMYPADKVHSIYPGPNAPQKVEKTVGGNWTFLLDPDKWDDEGSSDTFKQLYSCFPGRMQWEESMKKAVSGTGWHYVGDPGDYLLNSINGERRSLITAIGEKLEDWQLPDGVNLAYDLRHVGYSGFLKPGFAFISLKGQYHWHPVHTESPICIEVWRPFCEVKPSNSFGMDCF